MFDVKDTLLPPTATPLAKALDILEERLFSLPVQMISKNPATVDVGWLDHLAWENSVDTWDSDWPEDIKRSVIAVSAEVHRFKGTPYAIRTALAAFDVDTELLEWFEPEGVAAGLEAGSFRVTAYAGRSLYGDSENALDVRLVYAMNAVVQRAAPVSRKLTFRLGEQFRVDCIVSDSTRQMRRASVNEVVHPAKFGVTSVYACSGGVKQASVFRAELDVAISRCNYANDVPMGAYFAQSAVSKTQHIFG